MSPEEFERLAEGLSDREIIEAAIEAGFLPRKNFKRGEQTEAPLWLGKILEKNGVVEIVKIWRVQNARQ